MLFLLLLTSSREACARIVRIVVSDGTATPWTFEGKVFGSIGTYKRIQGIAYGELDLRDPHNSIIQDITLAPTNSNGKVEYATTFTLLVPSDITKWSGVLVYEIVNRGASILPNDFETGDAFLVSGWQGDLPFGGKSVYGLPGETIRVPVAKKADGSAVTGAVLVRFMNVVAGTSTLALSSGMGYSTSGKAAAPLDLDTSHAWLTTRTNEQVTGFGTPPIEVARADWAWGDCTNQPFPGKPDSEHLCLRNGFDPALLYEFVYTGKDPLVLGVGLAAMRDVASFFRNGSGVVAGFESPLAGRSMHEIVRGASQSGNLLRTFLNLDFNNSEDNKIIFEGAMSIIAARQTPINFRFAVPGGAGNVQELGSDGTVWWESWPDPTRRLPKAGLLDRCRISHTCPKIVELLGSSEFWSLRASPDFVGSDARVDIPLPKEVRRYYVASTQHGGGAGGFNWQPELARQASGPTVSNPIKTMPCALPANPNPMREIQAALLSDLKMWVVRGQEPPPSDYPTLAAHTLAPANSHDLGFPQTPQLPSPDGIANPLLAYDLGSSFHYGDLSGEISNRPAPIVSIFLPMVPVTNRDGNEVGGIHTVLQEAALGTYLGWNTTASGFSKGQYCALAGSYVPFALDEAERVRTFDTRPSLEARYGTQRGYACVARRATNDLVKRRLLLPKDADTLIAQAIASHILATDENSTAANRQRAELVCR